MSKSSVNILVGLFLGLIFTMMDGCSDASGYSKVSGYYDHYSGSMSYSYFKMTLRPISATSTTDLSLPILNYGSNLEDSKILKANILQSEIPLKDIEYIFYDTVSFKAFSPDSIYLAWVGLRGNYLYHPFKSKHGFAIVEYRAYAGSDAEVVQIGSKPDWNLPFNIYALVSFSLKFLFFIAFAAIISLPESKGNERILPLFFIAIYAATACYVDYIDYEFVGFQFIKPLLVGVLVVMYVWYLFKKPDAE